MQIGNTSWKYRNKLEWAVRKYCPDIYTERVKIRKEMGRERIIPPRHMYLGYQNNK
jgi:hypothetical protein